VRARERRAKRVNGGCDRTVFDGHTSAHVPISCGTLLVKHTRRIRHEHATCTVAPAAQAALRDPLQPMSSCGASPLTSTAVMALVGGVVRGTAAAVPPTDAGACSLLAVCMHLRRCDRCVGEPLKAACLHRRLRQGHARVLHRQQVAAWRGMVSRTAWCATQHGIPRGMVSRAAWHPTRRGMPSGRVSHTA
jgi:hypothetical protein